MSADRRSVQPATEAGSWADADGRCSWRGDGEHHESSGQRRSGPQPDADRDQRGAVDLHIAGDSGVFDVLVCRRRTVYPVTSGQVPRGVRTYPHTYRDRRCHSAPLSRAGAATQQAGQNIGSSTPRGSQHRSHRRRPDNSVEQPGRPDRSCRVVLRDQPDGRLSGAPLAEASSTTIHRDQPRDRPAQRHAGDGYRDESATSQQHRNGHSSGNLRPCRTPDCLGIRLHAAPIGPCAPSRLPASD